MTQFKIDQEDFNRKAQHILDTVVKPQVEKYEQSKAIEEAAANLADPNACKTDNWIAGAKWMREQIMHQHQYDYEDVLKATMVPEEYLGKKEQ
jgi:hypothetical protein